VSKKAFSLIELSIVILIIGILVAGVTQGSRLVAQMRLTSARAQTQSSPVASIRDLTFWIDSTSEKSFIDLEAQDGTLLSTWYNINPQRTKNYDMVQSGGSIYQPYYKTSAINNLPAVYFDGNSRSFYNTSVTIGDLVGNDQVTLFVVQKVSNSNSTPISWISGNSRFNFHTPFSDGYIHFDFGDSCCNAATRMSVAAPANFSSLPQVISVVKKQSGDAYININSVQLTSVSAAMTNTLNLALNDWLIIGNASGGGSSFSGYIGEIIIFSRSLRSDEVRDVERYLGKKWGIKVN